MHVGSKVEETLTYLMLLVSFITGLINHLSVVNFLSFIESESRGQKIESLWVLYQ